MLNLHEAMKTLPSKNRTAAMTLVEVLVIICALLVIVALLLPSLAAKNRGPHINCISNLKQVGIAFRLWEGDNNDKYPMAVSVTNGGAMELVAAGNVAACFRVMSNELSTPKILVCPQDTPRVWATNFSAGFENSHISYFVGLDVTNDINPWMFLSGDDNFAIGGVPVKSGVLQLPTKAPVTWAKARHLFVGNIGMADGSVQQVTTNGLREALQQTGFATNRLVLP